MGELKAAGRGCPVMAESVNLRQRQEADGRPADMPHVSDEARSAPRACTARQAAFAGRAACTARLSDLSLLGDFQGIVHLNAKVADCRFKFAVAKQ